MLVRMAYAVTFAFYAATNPYMWKRAAPFIVVALLAYVTGKYL